MECKKSQKLLSSYMDNKMSNRDKDLLVLHLRECGICREFLQDLKDTIKLIKSLDEVEPPPDLFFDIQSELEKVPGKKGLFQRPLWVRSYIEVLGTATVILLVFFLSRSLMNRHVPKEDNIFGQKEIFSPLKSEEVSSSVSKVSEELADVQRDDKGVYGLEGEVAGSAQDMDISAPSVDELIREEKLKDAAELEKKKIAAYFSEPPKVWKKREEIGNTLSKKVMTKEKSLGIMQQYNITMQLKNLYDGIDKLTTHIHNCKGKFITPPDEKQGFKEQETQKEIVFKIPRENYYQFMWNLEEIGTIKENIPIGDGKISRNDVTVHLKINVFSPDK